MAEAAAKKPNRLEFILALTPIPYCGERAAERVIGYLAAKYPSETPSAHEIINGSKGNESSGISGDVFLLRAIVYSVTAAGLYSYLS